MAARMTWTDDEVRALLDANKAVEEWSRARGERGWKNQAELERVASELVLQFAIAYGDFKRASMRLAPRGHRRRREQLKRLAGVVCQLRAGYWRREYANYEPGGGSAAVNAPEPPVTIPISHLPTRPLHVVRPGAWRAPDQNPLWHRRRIP